MTGKLFRAALGAAVTIFALSHAATAQTRLLFNCFWPAQHYMCAEVLTGWKSQVEKATDGRVLIDIPAHSLAPPPEQLAAVRSGIFDGSIQFNSFIANEITGGEIAMLPFVSVQDAAVNSIALWRTFERYFDARSEFGDVQLLSLFASPGVDLYSLTEAPVSSMDAVISHKLWALPGHIADVLKSAGAPVVSGPAVQMTELVQRGVVDGYVGIGSAASVALNLAPYVKSVVRTERKINAGAFSMFVNSAVWDKIGQEDQKAIMAVSGEAFARFAGSVWAAKETEALEKISGEIKVINASAEFETALAALGQGFVEDWIAEAEARGVPGREALAFYQSTIAQQMQ